MLSLQKFSSLPIGLTDNKLIFDDSMNQVKPEIRTLEQMRDVLQKADAKEPSEFYYMYRDCCLLKHCDFFLKNNLRYDITVLPAFTVCGEFSKTYGHTHSKKAATNITFPELYEVIKGTAHYLMQKEDDFILVEAKAGEKVIVPPNYGHVTVNPSRSETLVMANLVERNFTSDYSLFKEHHGAMYYETIRGFIKNQNYKKIPRMRKLKPLLLPQLGITEKPLYAECVASPQKFFWLKNPENYLEIFDKIFEKRKKK